MEHPKKENDYTQLEYEGIKIFVKKGIRAKNDLLTINISGFSIFKSIEVSGMDINL